VGKASFHRLQISKLTIGEKKIENANLNRAGILRKYTQWFVSGSWMSVVKGGKLVQEEYDSL
jgi:hypothetical protein